MSHDEGVYHITKTIIKKKKFTTPGCFLVYRRYPLKAVTDRFVNSLAEKKYLTVSPMNDSCMLCDCQR